MKRKCFILIFLFLIFIPIFSNRLTENSIISLITMAPGDKLHSAFGHSGFRVYDPDLDIDILFNYGVFPFYESGFIPKFLNGRLDYLIEDFYFNSAIETYIFQERMVIEQVLDLNVEQKNEVFNFLVINARPENKVYRYDFLFDNCSTRLRDVIKITLGESVRFTPNPAPDLTFREMLDLYVKDVDPLTDFAFDILLGTPTDRKVTPYEAMFLPDFLSEAFDHAILIDEMGTKPLVSKREVFYKSDKEKKILPFYVYPFFWFWILFIVFLIITVGSYYLRKKHSNRLSVLLRIPDFLLLILAGAVGLLLLYLWIISEHTVTDYNLNLLWANPFLIIFAFPLLFNVFKKIQYRFLQINVFILIVVILGWFFLPQNFHPAIFPFSLTLLLRYVWNIYRIKKEK